MEKSWKLYMLRCGDGSLYTGITTDVEARLAVHRSGKGAKYTRGRGPLTLVYTEDCGTHSDALKRECQIKALTREEKQRFLQNPTAFLSKESISLTEDICCDKKKKTEIGGDIMQTGLLIHPEELSKKWVDRMADLGVDTLGIHPWGGKRAEASMYELVEQLKTPEFRALVDYAKSRGLKVEYEMHAGSWLLPRNLFETHPEYFRVDETGERTAKRNFCVTNPEAMEYVAGRSRELAQCLYGSEDNYYFWLDDGRRYRCNCEKCAAYTSSDQLLLVANAMVRELRKVNPNAKVAYLAFYETLKLPQTVKPEEGVFLEYAPIERKFDRPVWEMPAEEIEKLKALLDFFGRKDAKVLEYWFDNSLFSKWKKPPVRYMPNNDLIRADVEYYRNLGFSNIASFACFLGEDYEELFGQPDVSAFAKNFLMG